MTAAHVRIGYYAYVPPGYDAQHGERAAGIPTPARTKHRCSKERLREDVLDACRFDVFKNDVERKCVLIGNFEWAD